MEIPKLSALTPFQRLVAVYILWNVAWAPTSSIIYVYFNQGGMSLPVIFGVGAFIYLAPLLVIPLFRGFAARDFMVAGMAISALSVLSLIVLPLPLAAFAYLFLSGLTCFAFWAPFNTMFYEFSKGNSAQLGAFYYSVSPVISLLVPALAGLFVQSFGFAAIYALSIVVFIIGIPIVFCLVENRKYEYSLIDSIKSISGLKSMLFMEGFTATIMVSMTLSVILLRYAGTPLQFGILTSLATVFSVIAAFVAARFSDRMERRRELLLVLVACFALSAIFTSWAQGIAMFILGYGLVNFFSRIFFPLPLALVVDNSKDLVSSMMGREFIFAISRVSGVLVGYLIAVSFSLEATLLFEGLALLLYIPIFEDRKRKLARH
jgi:MFS family permease